MRDPLILGAGPAGCAAAIALARGGAAPLLIDRSEEPVDSLCGGFLSWCTAAQLADLGVDMAATGAHPVSRLRLFNGRSSAELPLPRTAYGLSRKVLDTHLRAAALAAGADFACDAITSLEPGHAIGRERTWHSDTMMLATGKHDLRGHSRPRLSDDTALGLRLRLPPSPERSRLIGGAIELHLFAGGYAGIVLQEGGWANVCLALRKSALARAGRDPEALLEALMAQNPALAERMGADWRDAARQTIGAVPYGWIARTTKAGLYRLGDQAAVIPSLAGEGIGIALASGTRGAACWLEGGAAAAQHYQRTFARAAAPPVRLARALRALAESPAGSRLALLAARLAPVLIAGLADATRIPATAKLAPAAPAA